MMGSEPFDRTHAHLLRGFSDLCAEVGSDHATIREFQMREQAIAAPGAAFGYGDIIALLDEAALAFACPDFGMRLALRQGGTQVFGPLGAAMRTARTFGEALTYASTHAYAHSLAAKVTIRTRAGGGVFAGHEVLLAGVAEQAQFIEQMLLLGHLAAMRMTGDRARARRVEFRHMPIAPPATYRRNFGCDVLFGRASDGVVFSGRDLACPAIGSDYAAFDRASRHIDRYFQRQRPPLQAEVRGIVMRFLWNGRCANADIARALNLHTRTLHRRLADEGTTFQQVKDDARRDLLAYYLGQTDLDCGRISERLGFAEQSVLSRNCRRWFGAPPSTLRDRWRADLRKRPDGERILSENVKSPAADRMHPATR